MSLNHVGRHSVGADPPQWLCPVLYDVNIYKHNHYICLDTLPVSMEMCSNLAEASSSQLYTNSAPQYLTSFTYKYESKIKTPHQENSNQV